MGDSAQSSSIHLFERAAQLGRALLDGGGDAVLGRGGFSLLGMDVSDGGSGGIGTVCLVQGGRSFRCDYEQDATGEWHILGGGSGSISPEMVGPRPSAASVGTPLLTAEGGIGFTRSRRDREGADPFSPPSFDAVGFVATFSLRAADVVDHVVVDGRTIAVPDHGRLVVVWKASATPYGPTARPVVVAFDALGRKLAVLEPLSPFDDVTMRAITGLDSEQD
ncbi:hypothetical protein ABH935_000368 [Catenulispora sp. GAS73]|uniref:hypothetical protein n=1 Tax=Catenulispora sp. GAS73 TaxID=3156269 RepID=UPI00351266F9